MWTGQCLKWYQSTKSWITYQLSLVALRQTWNSPIIYNRFLIFKFTAQISFLWKLNLIKRQNRLWDEKQKHKLSNKSYLALIHFARMTEFWSDIKLLFNICSSVKPGNWKTIIEFLWNVFVVEILVIRKLLSVIRSSRNPLLQRGVFIKSWPNGRMVLTYANFLKMFRYLQRVILCPARKIFCSKQKL